jgi:hypothetical protein
MARLRAAIEQGPDALTEVRALALRWSAAIPE